MRILVVNDGWSDAGGVRSYLDAVAPGLIARGHGLRVLHCDALSSGSGAGPVASLPQISVADEGLDGAMAAVRGWAPDVVYSHNMSRLDVEARLLGEVPVVKFMHGYFGTCIGGQKMFAWPQSRPCARRFGPACIALYGPRRCGQLSAGELVLQYRWARAQRALYSRYRAIVVASEHMRLEYVGNGAPAARVQVNPLFPTHDEAPALRAPGQTTIVFAGRMTALKGGDLLVRAVAAAGRRLAQAPHLVMVGDGPRRARWEAMASKLGVTATFPGWLSGPALWDRLRHATLLAVPSTWPEPFGLVGLEANALGVPAIAFDVGGMRTWLRDGINGVLVPGDPPRAAALADGLVAVLGQPAQLAALRAGAVRVAREMSLARHLDRLEQAFAPAAAAHAHSAGW